MQQDDEIFDWDAADNPIDTVFSISSYGADYPIDSLVKRLRSGDIYIPRFDVDEDNTIENEVVGFLRNYVWSNSQGDRFIESLLLGLPVPGIFLVRETTGKLLVLDGQQRLHTILQFFDGERINQFFKLQNVQKRWKGKTYKTLEPADRRRLDDYVIHAMIIKQEEPSSDQNSIYLIFERLNSGGTILNPQEIRSALYHGLYANVLKELNQNVHWRTLVGKKSARIKDIELILRFFSLFYNHGRYKRPMKGFLNTNMSINRNCEKHSADELKWLFNGTIATIFTNIGKSAFRRDNSVNAALLDSLMYAAAHLVQKGLQLDQTEWLARYNSLLSDEEFSNLIKQSTADEKRVTRRLEIAKRYFLKKSRYHDKAQAKFSR